MASAYADVAGEGAVVAGLGYSSTVPLAGDGAALEPGAMLPTAAELTAAMRDRVAERRNDELDRGMTLVGPHRDDLVIHLGPAPAKGFASHGESWSLALALKLATFALLRAEGEDPILILDDVFATLDAERRAALATVARSAEQTLITAAVVDDVPPELRGVRVEVGDGIAVVVKEAVRGGGPVSDENVRPGPATSPAPRSRPRAPRPPPGRSRPAAGSPGRGGSGRARDPAPTTRSRWAGSSTPWSPSRTGRSAPGSDPSSVAGRRWSARTSRRTALRRP